MILLVAGLLVFFAPHFLPMATSSRAKLFAKWGERRYKGLFAAVSGIATMIDRLDVYCQARLTSAEAGGTATDRSSRSLGLLRISGELPQMRHKTGVGSRE